MESFLSEVPSKKYFRRLLTTKDKVPEVPNVPLNEECSAILKNIIPEKLGDTERFTLPCSIYNSGIISSLADLGASVNLMPYSLFKRLELKNLRPTKMTIQLADHSIKYPRGIAENVLVRIDKFTSVREWRLSLKTMEVKERNITGTNHSMDFPMINEDFMSLKHKYGYAQVIDSLESSKSAKTKYGGLAKLYLEEDDEKTCGESNVKIEYHWLPKNNFCTGSAFVAKPGAVEEDDSWIVTFAHDEDNDISYVLVVDAKKLEGEPIAKINLPQRVHYGHNGSFFKFA